MDNQERLWTLLARKLSGEISEAELQEFSSIVNADPELVYSAQIITAYWNRSPQKNIEEAKEAFSKLKM